jgi:hypothetical protein
MPLDDNLHVYDFLFSICFSWVTNLVLVWLSELKFEKIKFQNTIFKNIVKLLVKSAIEKKNSI